MASSCCSENGEVRVGVCGEQFTFLTFCKGSSLLGVLATWRVCRPLNWKGTPGKPEVCPVKSQPHTPSRSRVLVGAAFKTAQCPLSAGTWLDVSADSQALSAHTPSASADGSCCSYKQTNVCHSRVVTLYIYWVSGFEALSLELTMGKMAVCCITPFNKPHFIQGKWKAFFVVCKLDINIVPTRKCWNLPTHSVMFRLLKIMLFLHPQTSVFTLLPI